MQKLRSAIDKRGLKVSADRLGIKKSRLGNWVDRGVPVEHCAEVERVLGVSRKVLRPDDWQLIWPELKQSKRSRNHA